VYHKFANSSLLINSLTKGKEKVYLGVLGEDGVKLKWVLNKQDVRMLTGFNWLRYSLTERLY
jgi:hypothetical protein